MRMGCALLVRIKKMMSNNGAIHIVDDSNIHTKSSSNRNRSIAIVEMLQDLQQPRKDR